MSAETDQGESKVKARRPVRPFPLHTLEEALEVAKVIQEDNAGKPWKTPFVSQALNIKPGSTNFRDITSSAYRYGLISGTWNSPTLSLTPLGYSLTKPTDPKKRIKELQEATTKVEVFNKIYTHYKDAKIPKMTDEFFKNVIEVDFGVPKEYVEECLRIIFENGKYAQIIQEIKGSSFVMFSDEPPSETPPGEENEPEPEQEPGDTEPSSSPVETPPKKKQIFVAHGKNKIPLEQLKNILNQFKVEYQVAIDEPHLGRPISAKIAQLMKECTSGIFIFTADEATTDDKGQKVLRPSDNIVFELGAGTILYGEKIVIFREDGVSFGSDFTDFGRITFEHDKLDAKGIDLFKELIGQRLIQLSPT
jgi:hypothetical protein